MDVVITEWALQAYTDLKGRNVFTDQDYWSTLRPDVERLRTYPSDPKFSHSGFWSPAQDKGGVVVASGFKMKWHNLGPGRVQLRLAVALHGGEALLCQAYVKDSATKDFREIAKFRGHISLIQQGRYIRRGTL